MSAFVIGAVKSISVFFSIMTIISVLASLFFLLLRKPTPILSEDDVKTKSKETDPTIAQTW